jgi:pimeloyl-ACP methyl ester carboxylesterase
MNSARRSPKSKVQSPKSGTWGRPERPFDSSDSLRATVLVVCGCLLLLSCFKLDSFLFDPTPVTEYLEMNAADSLAWHVRGIIPDSLVKPETLTVLDGNKVYGFFVRQPADTDGPELSGVTVLYNHGNGQNINRYWGRVELLWEAGCNVFIYDYEGYGKSEGSPAGDACYADAEAALAYVLARPDVVDSMVVYYGWSMGSFMACHLAADNVWTPRCIILENPLASTSALAKEGAVLEIPGSFLANADFDNEGRMRFLGCRTLIIYGTQDQTAVPARHALVLLDKGYGWLPELIDYPIAGADHSDLPEVMGYSEYERVVSTFIAGDSL